MNVGDVFEFEGDRFSIKRIDLDGSHPANKSGEPRVDASQIVFNDNGEERLKKGRPRKFEVETVYRIFEEPVPAAYEAYVAARETSEVDEFKAAAWSAVSEPSEGFEEYDSSSSVDEIEEALSDPDLW